MRTRFDTVGTARAEARGSPPLLEVRDLCVSFETDSGVVSVVDDVSLAIPAGRTVALVGESGCGKSVTAMSILRLIPQPPGRIERGRIILRDGASKDGSGETDLLTLDERAMRRVRGNRIAMIFQEPLNSLNPVFSVGEQIVEAIELHQPLRGRAAWSRAVETLDRVGIADAKRRARDYPHQLSGGMRQRVMIAMALSCEPDLLIADEPTTALDATIQRQVLELLRSLLVETGMGILLITHDIGVVAEFSDEAYVMYAGRIVEHAAVADLVRDPLHPYTRALMRCSPGMVPPGERLAVIPGSVPDPESFPRGCRFHPRCAVSAERARDTGREALSTGGGDGVEVLRRCVEVCDSESSGAPKLAEHRPGRFVACWET